MTTEAIKPLAYGIDSYLEWIKREGLLVHEGLALNLIKLETADWPRFGVNGAALHFRGSGDFCSMFLMDIGAGRASNPIQHVFEAIYYVFEGRGSTQLEFSDGTTRSFEWGPRSFFAIPLNAKYRHFNASGTERALLAATTTAPLMMKILANSSSRVGTIAARARRTSSLRSATASCTRTCRRSRRRCTRRRIAISTARTCSRSPVTATRCSGIRATKTSSASIGNTASSFHRRQTSSTSIS